MEKKSSNGKQTATSLENTHDLERVFQKFDANGDGKISVTELRSVLTALGSSTSPDELQRAMTEIDKNGDGLIDIREFAAFFENGNKDLKDAFEMYDKDRNGVISARELHAVMKELGEKCSLRDCCKMIKSVDVDGDGCVNYEEFKNMMR